MARPAGGACGIRPGIAERILINAKQMYKWAVKRRLVPTNPLADISARNDLQVKKVPGSRSLSEIEKISIPAPSALRSGAWAD